jgi:hypothetical protein
MENLYVDFNLIKPESSFYTWFRVQESHISRLKTDFVPPIGIKTDGLTGIEALIISFCGCVKTAVVALLRRSDGKEHNFIRRTATGIRRENPLSLEKIIFEVRVNQITSSLKIWIKFWQRCKHLSRLAGYKK